jgi:atypical dual specificity phosphatase
MPYVNTTLPSSSGQHTQQRSRTSNSNEFYHNTHNMSYHRGGGYPQQWTLAPTNPVASPSSALPFSPSHHTRPASNVTEILPRLFISDLSFVENPALLTSYRITHILSVMPDSIFRPPPSLLPVQPARLQIRVEDLPFAELAAHLPTTTSWIWNALSSSSEARVVVHCAEGISRSVSVVAAYLMASNGWPPMQAIDFIKSKRRIANPNFGFIQQLHEYSRNSLGRMIPIPAPPFFSPP